MKVLSNDGVTFNELITEGYLTATIPLSPFVKNAFPSSFPKISTIFFPNYNYSSLLIFGLTFCVEAPIYFVNMRFPSLSNVYS